MELKKSAARASVHLGWANRYTPELIYKIRFRKSLGSGLNTVLLS